VKCRERKATEDHADRYCRPEQGPGAVVRKPGPDARGGGRPRRQPTQALAFTNGDLASLKAALAQSESSTHGGGVTLVLALLAQPDVKVNVADARGWTLMVAAFYAHDGPNRHGARATCSP
jgi:hypothetical protein